MYCDVNANESVRKKLFRPKMNYFFYAVNVILVFQQPPFTLEIFAITG